MGAEGLLGRAPPGPTPECPRLAGEGLSCPWTSAAAPTDQRVGTIKGWGRHQGPGALAWLSGLLPRSGESQLRRGLEQRVKPHQRSPRPSPGLTLDEADRQRAKRCSPATKQPGPARPPPQAQNPPGRLPRACHTRTQRSPTGGCGQISRANMSGLAWTVFHCR